MVELQSHHALWAASFAQAADELAAALTERVDAIEHIGSTAVPGLLAKPIIGMAARTACGADPFAMGEALDSLGYAMHGAGPKNHAVYVRSVDGRRTHILHVFSVDQWPHCNQRLFRDKLLHDESARRRYQQLKEEIAGTTDGRAYTAAKSSLIQELLDDERRSRGLPPVDAWDKQRAARSRRQCSGGPAD
ncbi:GrpB family protein [Brachybacterium tyrofermentans]|uniref:GrpB family protein n=1 Tax=Brachybacterium tyrofermentans TaxID=47848 RepID=UPI003FD18BFC